MLKLADNIRHKYLLKCRLRYLTLKEHDFVYKIIGKELNSKDVSRLRRIYDKQRQIVGSNEYSYPR